jgi:hypothetical protein
MGTEVGDPWACECGNPKCTLMVKLPKSAEDLLITKDDNILIVNGCTTPLPEGVEISVSGDGFKIYITK